MRHADHTGFFSYFFALGLTPRTAAQLPAPPFALGMGSGPGYPVRRGGSLFRSTELSSRMYNVGFMFTVCAGFWVRSVCCAVQISLVWEGSDTFFVLTPCRIASCACGSGTTTSQRACLWTRRAPALSPRALIPWESTCWDLLSPRRTPAHCAYSSRGYCPDTCRRR